MSKDWSTFGVKYLSIPMASLVCGLVIGFGLAHSEKNHKEYPVKVVTCYETKNIWYNDVIECDSIKGDTIYKDSLSIINKKIVNVSFK